MELTHDQASLRRLVIDWLDDNFHFGDAEALIGDDEDKSFLKNGNPARLPFPFGYHWREGGAGSGLLIATRPLTTAGTQATIVR